MFTYAGMRTAALHMLCCCTEGMPLFRYWPYDKCHTKCMTVFFYFCCMTAFDLSVFSLSLPIFLPSSPLYIKSQQMILNFAENSLSFLLFHMNNSVPDMLFVPCVLSVGMGALDFVVFNIYNILYIYDI